MELAHDFRTWTAHTPTPDRRIGGPSDSPADHRAAAPRVLHHVAIVTRPVAELWRSGRKLVESRLMRTPRAPFAQVAAGDWIHLKAAGGGFIGSCPALRAEHWHQLTPQDVRRIRRRHGVGIAASDQYWRERLRARFAVLVWLDVLHPSPTWLVVPRQFGNAWIILPPNVQSPDSHRDRLASAPLTL